MTLLTAISYLAIALHAVSLGFGAVILWAAWFTLRPAKGVHLMWWHILAITVGVWGWHSLFVLRVVSDLRLYDTTTLLPGTAPLWYLCVGTAILALDDVAFWLILKVQRGRRRLQGSQ
jgi:hypothetical protein